jgi:hypothetical protein
LQPTQHAVQIDQAGGHPKYIFIHTGKLVNAIINAAQHGFNGRQVFLGTLLADAKNGFFSFSQGCVYRLMLVNGLLGHIIGGG